MKQQIIYGIILFAAIFTGCDKQNKFPDREKAENRVSGASFNKKIDGDLHKLYRLENANGIVVSLTNTGASIVQVIVPDKNGNFEDIALGYKSPEEYLENSMYNGCVVGRYGNRIANGKFYLNGKEYQLSLNDGPNTLHGGIKGINLAFWEGTEIEKGVRFNYTSPDMDEGFPGELSMSVSYTLNDNNELKIEYRAETTDSTFINLTNHTYWNLDGEAMNDILDHEIMIPAEFITPVGENLIPDGSFMKVENTAFDFRQFHKIGERINEDHPQLIFGNGYDHNYVLSMEDSDELHPAAILKSEKSGRFIEVSTSEPGIQFYSGNFMDGSLKGKNNQVYKQRYALALETQHFPDSPNQPAFPSTLLTPGVTWHSVTLLKFGTN